MSETVSGGDAPQPQGLEDKDVYVEPGTPEPRVTHVAQTQEEEDAKAKTATVTGATHVGSTSSAEHTNTVGGSGSRRSSGHSTE